MSLNSLNDTSYNRPDHPEEIANICKRYFHNEHLPRPHVALYYDAWKNDFDDDPLYSLLLTITEATNNQKALKDSITKKDIIKTLGKIAGTFGRFNPDDLAESLYKGDILEPLRERRQLDEKISQFIDSLFPEHGERIKQHLSTYPEYIKNGGRYQIPQDHYERIKYLLSISKEQANKMPTGTGEFSLKQWREVHSFFENGDVKLSDIEPSTLKYESVQANTIEKTISDERKSIKKTDKAIRDEAYAQSKPSLQEGLKTGAVSAVIEGGVTFGLEIRKKVKSGKSIRDFTADDWSEICKRSGLGTVKGGIRGISIYALTNYTATPAAVANALVTASFGIAQQAYLLKEGKISQEDFIRNSEELCVDVSVSALSSFIGQAIIPVPVVGAVIGNTIGNLIYQTAKENMKKQDKQLIKSYIQEIEALSQSLDAQYKQYVKQINIAMKEYFLILEDAFAVDCVQAFDGSIQLARYIGVSEEDILKTIDEIDDYILS